MNEDRRLDAPPLTEERPRMFQTGVVKIRSHTLRHILKHYPSKSTKDSVEAYFSHNFSLFGKFNVIRDSIGRFRVEFVSDSDQESSPVDGQEVCAAGGDATKDGT